MTSFTRDDLVAAVAGALQKLGGRGTIVDVAREIWRAKEGQLKGSGDLFYTWQYDMRWAATRLRQSGVMAGVDRSPTGVWELAKS